ncbi:Cell division control protein 42 [Mycena venus]|uniref:Cell division control protein 42 n=1 Tax=Mycena venus TaxID=2733690 RepID=A0A8H6ZAZ0_9AGAR|nr:Cell division control protein 42 [Mycena venus]
MNNVIKCTLVGDSAAEKVLFLSYKRFPTGYVPTVYGGHAGTVMVSEIPHVLCVFDTAGESDYDRFRPLSYP